MSEVNENELVPSSPEMNKADELGRAEPPKPRKPKKARKPEAGIRYQDVDTGKPGELAKLVLASDDGDPRWDPGLLVKLDPDFVRNIAENGIDVDLDVTEAPPFPKGAYPAGSFGINDGRSRVRAIPEANKLRKAKGLPPLVVGLKIRERDDLESMRAAARLNAQRKQEDAITIGRKAQRFLDMNLTEQEIAKDLGIKTEQVHTYVSLLQLPEAVQQAILRGEVSVTAAATISRLDPKEIERRTNEHIAAKKRGDKGGSRKALASSGPDRLTAKGIKTLIDELKEEEKKASSKDCSRYEAARYALETVLDARKRDGLWAKLTK